MKQRGQKLLCVHRADEGALCHITESGISVHCAHLCLVKTGMCTLDGAHRRSKFDLNLSLDPLIRESKHR